MAIHSETPESTASADPTNGGIKRTLLRLGVLCLLISPLFLWSASATFSPGDQGAAWSFAISMMLARSFGLAAFIMGAALLVLQSWTAGTLLIIGSIVLPCFAFIQFGTI